MVSSPWAKSWSQLAFTSGKVSARVKPKGAAPIAARSLAATARARWPSLAGGALRGK